MNLNDICTVLGWFYVTGLRRPTRWNELGNQNEQRKIFPFLMKNVFYCISIKFSVRVHKN